MRKGEGPEGEADAPVRRIRPVAKPNAGIILVALFSKDRQRLPEDSAVAPPPHGMGGIM